MHSRNRRSLSVFLLLIALLVTPLTTYAASAPASTSDLETESFFAGLENLWQSLVALLPSGAAVETPASAPQPPAAPTNTNDLSTATQEPDGDVAPSIANDG